MYSGDFLRSTEVRAVLRPTLLAATFAILGFGILGGWAGSKWPIILGIAMLLGVSVLWIGRRAETDSYKPGYVYLSAAINSAGTAAIVLVAGGADTPFWLLFAVGAVAIAATVRGTTGLWLGLMNAAVAALVLVGPLLLAGPSSFAGLSAALMQVTAVLLTMLIFRSFGALILRHAESLVESEQRYREVINTARDVVVTIAADRTITSLNPSFEEFTGWSRLDWLGRPFEGLIAEQDRPRAMETFGRILQGESLRAVRFSMPTRSGAVMTIELNMSPQFTGGRAVGLLGIARDMTDEQRAQDAIKASEERFRALAAATNEGIVFHDQGVILDVNAAATAMFGHDAAARLAGRNIMEFVAPQARAQVESLLASGRLEPFESFALRRDGSTFPVEVQPRPIQDNGRTIHVVSIRDISDRRRAEQEIRRSADQMRALFDTTRDLALQRDLSELLHLIIVRATALLGASGGGMYVCEPDQRRVRCVVSYNTPRDYTGTFLKYGEGAAGLVAETGEPVIVDDYRAWPNRAAAFEVDRAFVSVMSVPLRWQDRVIGVIHVLDDSRAGAFGQDELGTMTLFAHQAAIALENARLFEALGQRRDEAAAVADVSRQIGASLRVDVVLDRIVSHAGELLRADTTAVYLAEPGTSTLRAFAAIGPDSDEIKAARVTVGTGILGAIAGRRVGEIINDTAADPRALQIQGTALQPLENLMAAAILSQEQLLGLIAVWRSGQGQEFSKAELDFLSSLASQAAVAIENARLFEAEQGRRREADTLRRAAEHITSTLDREQATELILEELSKVVKYDSASVQLLGDGYLEIIAGRGWPDPAAVIGVRFPVPGDNPNATVVLQRQPMILEDAPGTFPQFNKPPHNHIRSWLGVPLVVRDQVIGMFAVDHSQPGLFTEADVQLVTAFAGHAALAIENARLFQETQRRLVDLETLQAVTTALRTAATLDEVLPIVLDQLVDLLGFDTALVDTVERSSGQILTRLARGAWAPMTGRRTPMDAGGSGQVIATGEPYVSDDLSADGVCAFPGLLAGVKAGACIPIVMHDKPVGALWVGRQTPISREELRLLTSLGEMFGTTIRRMSLTEQTELLLKDVQSANMELAQAYDTTLKGWAGALELRDKETEGHTQRVTELTLRLAKLCGISESEMIHVRRGALLHDIGKMGVPDHILKKTTDLTRKERELMHEHPIYAYNLLRPITYLAPAMDIPYFHHEKWDGSGYPRGVRGEDIPLAARVFAVVDVWDALTHDRPYRKALSRKQASEHLRSESGKHFDPRVAEAFLKMVGSRAPSRVVMPLRRPRPSHA